MKNNRFLFCAGLVLLTGMGLAFAGANAPAARTAPAGQEDTKARKFKNILFNLVRQDEYLDEAVETLNSAREPISAQRLSAMGLSLKLIAGSITKVSALSKTEFSEIRPGSRLRPYTNAILSYSRKIDRKAGQLNTLVARMSAKSRKAVMRDAVNSGKGGKKIRGKKMAQIIEERKAMDALAANLKNLRGAARDLSATSKWLYIASR